MCTIAVLRGLHPEFPLIVAANRDEFYARASAPPGDFGRTDAGEAITAGRDGAAGGTWMGVTSGGFFVGVTNQRTGAPARADRRSRGEVVRAALRAGEVAGVDALLAALDPRAFNPFNLVYGDARGVKVAYVRDDPPSRELHALGAGAHVLANDRIGSADFPKAARALALLDVGTLGALDADALVARLGSALADHALPEAVPDPPPGSLFPAELARRLQALCIHTPAYGTVSSTLLLLRAGGVARYLFAPGSPCAHPYETVG